MHTAFGDAPSRPRIATARAFARASLRRHMRPRERVVSTPIAVALHRARYRRHLRGLFDLTEAGHITAPAPALFAFADYSGALIAAEQATPGTKIVLAVAE